MLTQSQISKSEKWKLGAKSCFYMSKSVSFRLAPNGIKPQLFSNHRLWMGPKTSQVTFMALKYKLKALEEGVIVLTFNSMYILIVHHKWERPKGPEAM